MTAAPISFRDGCGRGRPGASQTFKSVATSPASKLWRGSQPSSLLVRVAVGSPCGQKLVEHLADRLHHLLVGVLAMAASSRVSTGQDVACRGLPVHAESEQARWFYEHRPATKILSAGVNRGDGVLLMAG